MCIMSFQNDFNKLNRLCIDYTSWGGFFSSFRPFFSQGPFSLYSTFRNSEPPNLFTLIPLPLTFPYVNLLNVIYPTLSMSRVQDIL